MKTGYAAVNGLNLYWESHGQGEPLILLHGGFQSTSSCSKVIDALSKSRNIIAVDLQAHGRTADIERPMRYQSMADDIAALIQVLGFSSADVMGYSLGAGVALWTAIRHPGSVRKLVVVSIPFRRDGWYPDVVAGMKRMSGMVDRLKETPVYKNYVAIAPEPHQFPALIKKVSELVSTEFDWSNEVAAMKTPAMLVFADADIVRPSHMAQFYELLGGGKKDPGWDGSDMPTARLAILPGLTHYSLFSSALLAACVETFL